MAERSTDPLLNQGFAAIAAGGEQLSGRTSTHVCGRGSAPGEIGKTSARIMWLRRYQTTAKRVSLGAAALQSLAPFIFIEEAGATRSTIPGRHPSSYRCSASYGFQPAQAAHSKPSAEASGGPRLAFFLLHISEARFQGPIRFARRGRRKCTMSPLPSILGGSMPERMRCSSRHLTASTGSQRLENAGLG